MFAGDIYMLDHVLLTVPKIAEFSCQGSRTKTAGAMGYFSKTRSSSGTSSGSVASDSKKDQDLSHQFLKRPG